MLGWVWGGGITAVTRGLGPDSLNDWCSNEEGVGMETGMVLRCCLYIVAIPPAWPARGLSM